jgi:hypothetical protein
MAVLRSLGKPPGWREAGALATALDEAYEAASLLACRLALGETDAIEQEAEDDRGADEPR